MKSGKDINKENYQIRIPEDEQKLIDRCIKTVSSKYGPHIPKVIMKRLQTELDAVIKQKSATWYLIAADLADVSWNQGYPVNCRGTLSSLFIAYLLRLTAVNPLPAHYYCPNCRRFKLAPKKKREKGLDGTELIAYDCPVCGTQQEVNGFDLLPEICMGLHLDKEPEFALNFAPEVLPDVISRLKEQFGADCVFRSGVQHIDEKGETIINAHPGGVFIMPEGMDICDLTDLKDCEPDDPFQMKITVKDYYTELAKILKKIDILPMPSLGWLHYLEQATGYPHDAIPLGVTDTVMMFSGEKVYEIPTLSQVEAEAILRTGACGLSELSKVSGMVHGTGSWWNNNDQLVLQGHNLKDLISSRDDIMQMLMRRGFDKDYAWALMRRIWRGKGLTDEIAQDLRSAEIPEWFIESCSKMEYLFPKSHIVEYTIINWKLAFYKAYAPEVYEVVMGRREDKE